MKIEAINERFISDRLCYNHIATDILQPRQGVSMNRTEFLDKVDATRRDWDEAVARVPADRLTELGLTDGWSIKDLIAHVLWYEREMIDVIRERALVGSALWALPLAERNAAIHAEFRARTAADVLAETASVWGRLRPELETLTDDDLADANRFRDLAEAIPGAAPWQVIGSNTFEHYEDHARDVRARLDRTGSSSELQK
jgi:uncharacterized damage-inducible protein DinB